MVIRLGPGAEFDLIRRFLSDARGAPSADAAAGRMPGVLVGPGDDCAVVAGEGIALSVDMAVEDVHFRRAWASPAELGYHAATAALSDLAAVAARPIGLLASVALGPGDEGPADEGLGGDRGVGSRAAAGAEPGMGVGLMAGVAEAARDHGAALLGGDLTRSPGPLVVDIVAVGEAVAPVLRSGARPGDEVWVTGELGGAAAAVETWLRGETPEPAVRAAWARPRARTREALWLRERGVPTAMVDLSDGVAGDAGHIAAASGVRVVLRAASLPVAPAVRAAGAAAVADAADATHALRLAAAGGEDYELCFTASPGSLDGLAAAFEAELGTRLTRVGTVEQGEGAVVVDERGSVVRVEAFQHWRAG